jgi:hypothetical protein
MKKIIDSEYLLYLSIFLMFIVVFFLKQNRIHFEHIDFGFIQQILHPENPKGGLQYDPQLHYNYIAAFLIKYLGYENNQFKVAGFIWFVENGLTVVSLIILCNYIFNKDRITLILVVLFYLLLKSGETEQKTMLRFLYFLAIYFFLKDKWQISAVFGASIFYFHVGMAVWWVVPSCFGLACIFFKSNKLSFIQLTYYPLLILFFASPIVYFNFSNLQSLSEQTSFIQRYVGYVVPSGMRFFMQPIQLIDISFVLVIFGIGYVKLEIGKSHKKNIIPIAVGTLMTFILTIILVDVFDSQAAVKLQMYRVKINLEIFSNIFLAFLLGRQIKKGNYVFFLLYFSYFTYGRIFGIFWIGKVTQDTLYHLYFLFIVFEIFEKHIGKFLHWTFLFLRENRILDKIYVSMSNLRSILMKPTVFSCLLILLLIPNLPESKTFKNSIKSLLGIPQQIIVKTNNPGESLYIDIVEFINKSINDRKTLILPPPNELDFEFYTKHKILFNRFTPLNNVKTSTKSLAIFEYIFKNDFNFTLEKMFLKDGKYNPQHSMECWKSIWEELDEKTIFKWKERYELSHLIRENFLPLNLKVLYKNAHYTIYEI